MRSALFILLTVPALLAEDSPGRLTAHVPEFNSLFDPGARVERVAEGFEFTEGPVWSPQHFLLFSDIYGDRIYKWTQDGGKSVFRESAGNPNGLTFDQHGCLLICEQKKRRLIRLGSDNQITVLADKWDGKALNCPNDVVVRRDGTIYFTDPYWKFPPGSVQELAFQGVYRISPKGKLSVEAKDFGLPNGIGLSPDEKTLYIGDTRRRKIYAFDVARNGSLTGQRLLADLQSTEKGAVDGMKIDELGNIYSTGPGGVWVISKTGQHLGTIQAPEIPANCAWGGVDGRTLYMTARTGLYRIRVNVTGVRP